MAENEVKEENPEQQAQADEADAVKKKGEGGSSGSGGGGGLNPKVFLIVLAVNTLVVVVLLVVILLKQKSSDQPTLSDIAAEKDAGDGHAKKDDGHGDKKKDKDEGAVDNFIKENFTVNLADSQGAHFAQVEINIEVGDSFAKEEIQKIRPKIRDFIVVVLSSKNFEQVESNDGKNFLREEIRNKINSFMTRGQIKNIYFTQFIVQ